MSFRRNAESAGALGWYLWNEPVDTVMGMHDQITTNLADGYFLLKDTSWSDVGRDVVSFGDLYANDSEFRGGITDQFTGAATGFATDGAFGAFRPNRLTTKADDAVFWSGIRNGDSAAANWVARNGGSTLETTLASRGIKLPAWDANNPAVVSAWRQASADFAPGASGNVRVLQSDAVRLRSVWAEVEFPALKANPNVISIRSVNPETGVETLLWSR